MDPGVHFAFELPDVVAERLALVASTGFRRDNIDFLGLGWWEEAVVVVGDTESGAPGNEVV